MQTTNPTIAITLTGSKDKLPTLQACQPYLISDGGGRARRMITVQLNSLYFQEKLMSADGL